MAVPVLVLPSDLRATVVSSVLLHGSGGIGDRAVGDGESACVVNAFNVRPAFGTFSHKLAVDYEFLPPAASIHNSGGAHDGDRLAAVLGHVGCRIQQN